MSQWRLIILGVLIAIPPLVLMAAGGYFFWSRGWSFYVWWPLAACLASAYLLGWWWQRKRQLLPPVDFTAPLHWTERDQEAWRLVEARAKAASAVPAERLTKLPYYVEIAQSMAEELARHYHPSAKDPIEALTIPEILAVIELAARDLAEMVDQYLPGGHLLTIRNWRQAGQVSEWYTKASNVYWAISALFSPVNTAVRYGASKLGLSRPLQMLQSNVLAWFYTAYIHRVGTYLIDVNSGRLRIGAKRYRELTQRAESTEASAPSAAGEKTAPPAAPPTHVPATKLVVLGQVKAGKSSLINALLGERRAATDVLPATNSVTRYELRSPDEAGELVLLDTAGYGHAGPKADQLADTHDALQQSDLAILVSSARDPAREADLVQLRELREWFAARPHLKMPRILGVLTHIDLLSPLLEWSPPYDWLEPKRAKEQSIAEAVKVAEEQLGGYLAGVAPVCTADGKLFGIQEALLPRLMELLDEARAVSLLRCLHTEAEARKVRRVFDQLLQAGRRLAQAAMGK
jgi:uncharacterized protein